MGEAASYAVVRAGGVGWGLGNVVPGDPSRPPCSAVGIPVSVVLISRGLLAVCKSELESPSWRPDPPGPLWASNWCPLTGSPRLTTAQLATVLSYSGTGKSDPTIPFCALLMSKARGDARLT